MRRRSAERAGLAALVLLGHLPLLGVWAPPPARRQPTAPTQPPLVVRLIQAPPDARQPSPRPTAVAPARAPLRAAVAAAPVPAVEPGAIAVLPAPVPDQAAATSPPPLQLALPRAASAPRSMREQMRDDPRANSPSATLTSRLAAVAGTAEWTEERMDATRTRFRRHGQCVEVHVSRNAQLDPWNQSHAPTPKAVKPEC
jgi:hypothetical protein